MSGEEAHWMIWAPMTVALPTPWTLIALGLSLLALLLSFLNFRRKSSLKVRASYVLTSSTDSDDRYVSSIVVENLKDRAVTIFAIYLRVGHNYYVEIDDFEKAPLVLRPFETWHREYGPIEFYSVSSRRIAMNPLLKERRTKKRVVLSTSEGKYVVTRSPRRWSPVYSFFYNHMTAAVRPVRSSYKGTAIGGRIAYVVEIVSASGESEIIPIHPRDFEVQLFRRFQLTKDSLASADALKRFFDAQVAVGALTCQSVDVVDVAAWRVKEREFYKGPTVDARKFGWFTYRVIGQITTIVADLKLRKQNQVRQKRPRDS